MFSANKDMKNANKKRGVSLWTYALLILLFSLGYFINSGPYRNFPKHKVVGGSMLPTYKPNTLVRTLEPLQKDEIRRGDIVVFNHVNEKKEEKIFMKRVIGVPKDSIVIKDRFVFVNVDGVKINEPYLLDQGSTYETCFQCDLGFVRNGAILIVPNNSFFVLGDNRVYSSDSRVFGFITRTSIIGFLPLELQKKEREWWKKGEDTGFPEDAKDFPEYAKEELKSYFKKK